MALTKDNSTLAELLNELIKINYGRIGGYNKAHEQMKDNKDLKAIFKERTRQSFNFILDLKDLVSNTLGDVMDNIPVPGKVFRTRIKNKNIFNANKNASLLDSCELEEEGAVEAYEEVLKSGAEIPSDIREKIIEQQNEIKKSHDFIKKFRDFNLDLSS